MTKIYRKNLYRAVFLLAPLLLFDAGCTQAAPDTRPSHQTLIPAEASSVQIFSMEFRHPVADGALVRIVCQIAKGLDPNSFISCLGEFVGKEFTDGRHLDIRERYVPWTPELEASLHAVITAKNLAAENDYGARADTVANPAYNILVAYKDGRSLHITSEGETVNKHEAAIEDILLTWTDNAFDAAKE